MTKTTIADIKRELEDEIRRCKMDLEAQIEELKTSMNFINEEFEKNKDELGTVKAENRKLWDENLALKSKCELLTTQVTGTQHRIRECEPYSRNANVELKVCRFAEMKTFQSCWR